MAKFNKSFYQELEAQGFNSAREVVPFLLELIKPSSVVDVGCGTGEWLSVYQELGVRDVFGIDFHSGEMLKIPMTSFVRRDLSEPFTLPRKYDLAMSLEVAQYFQLELAEKFIGSLTSLSDVVLFSSAIPSQCGIGHVNEQWPDYWASLFDRFDFVPVDCVRPQFWENQNVTCYYAQNAVLYVRRGFELPDLPSFNMRRMVHPGLFEDQATELRKLRPLFSSRGLVKRLPGALWLSVSDRIKSGV
jgi:SAM-dependent methyltransferase